MRNPLRKRIPRELAKDWHKYLVIVVFMVLMIGVISGMYVGHDSMLASVYADREELNLEDGHFELAHKASEELLDDIAMGNRADVRQYFIDKGMKEADDEVAKAVEEQLIEEVKMAIEDGVREQCSAYGITDEKLIQEQIDTALNENLDSALEETRKSADFKKAVEDAYEEAHDTVIEKVDEEWEKIAKRYDLNDTEFTPVTTKIYDNFYKEGAEDNDNDGSQDADIRIYKSDSLINQASFIKGRVPKADNEIAIDRMHADNVGVGIGDQITIHDSQYEIVGLFSYVNYLTLHESNTDLMFDAFGFDVAMLTPEAFEQLELSPHYNYAFKYDVQPKDKMEQADASENFLKALITQTVVYDNEIKDYLPEYISQASNFAVSDIEGDSTTTSILCYILIAIIAFIFAITTSNTIDNEASVIGTLRASGYSRTEMIRHYMSMPVVVTILGAIIGNILGYTAFRNVAIKLYYQSYSLPTCGLVWSNVALVKTTVIPLLLMFFINLVVITKKLQLSPLRFLRHDLTKNKRTKARRLPRWSFMRRFRLRILFQNMPNYLVLILGVIFIELMLCFAFGLPDSLNHYGEKAGDMMFAEYQYMLTDYRDEEENIIQTNEASAEPFCMKSLLYDKNTKALIEGMGSGSDEGVTVYGIAKDSKYIQMDESSNEYAVYFSSAFMRKFDLAIGDRMTLHEEFENQSYEFTIAGEVEYDGGIAVFMPRDKFCTVFGKEEDEFSGYFAHKEINDIEEKYIATVIDKEDILKVTKQLQHSVGGILSVFKYVLVVLAASLIYLLAKIIIERNEHSISMVKILGFKNSEIGALYIVPTAIVVILFSIISFAVGYYLMLWIFKAFVLQMDGYFAYYMSPASMVLSVVYLLIGYAFVSVIDFARIKRIPLNVALKNVE